MPAVYEKKFFSELSFVKPIISECLAFLEFHFKSLTSGDIFEMKLILSELLFNAVIHGNNCDRNKYVIMKLEASEGSISVTIKDEGSGFNYRSLIQNFNSEDNLFRESGRGIRLVFKLADNLIFNEAGNEIKFSKRIGLHAQNINY